MLWSPFTKTDSLTLSCYHYCYCISHLFSSQLIYLVISIFYHYFIIIYFDTIILFCFLTFEGHSENKALIRSIYQIDICCLSPIFNNNIFDLQPWRIFMKKNQVLFSDVFRGYRKRPVACIRLRNIVVKQITHQMVTQKPHSCCQVPANNLTNNLN